MNVRPANQTEEELLEHRGGHSVGTWTNALFVIALEVFHGSLLFSYFMIRHEATDWPPAGHDFPPLAGMIVSTSIVLASIVPLGFSYYAIRRDRILWVVLGLVAMLTLGWSFFAIQAVSYTEFDLQPVDNVYSALIVVIAGYQLLVTLLGLMIAGVVLIRALFRHFNSERYVAIETLVFTWGFVTVSWLLTAATIYLTPYVF